MEKNHSFSVLQYLKDGNVYVRMTVDGVRTEMSAKVKVEKNQWIPGKGRARGSSEDVKRLNKRIKAFEDRINDVYDELLKKGKIISGAKIKSIIEGGE